MKDIRLHLSKQGDGAFYINGDGGRVAEMVIRITGNDLAVFHTEVAPELSGQGISKQLLEKMVSYAREQQLKVIPLCAFVSGQFKKYPELYEDVWKRMDENY